MLPPHIKVQKTVSLATAEEVSLDAAAVGVCQLLDANFSKVLATVVFLRCASLTLLVPSDISSQFSPSYGEINSNRFNFLLFCFACTNHTTALLTSASCVVTFTDQMTHQGFT